VRGEWAELSEYFHVPFPGAVRSWADQHNENDSGHGHMNTLCITSCGKKKIWEDLPQAGPTPEKDVYTGAFSGTCIRYASKFYPESFVILSAKFGFLMPDDLIESDYCVTFKDKKTNRITNQDLIKTAQEKGLFDYAQIVVIAGREYFERIRLVFKGKLIHAPLEGCGSMGEMISMLRNAIKNGRPL